jgi:hypothetical protein
MRDGTGGVMRDGAGATRADREDVPVTGSAGGQDVRVEEAPGTRGAARRRGPRPRHSRQEVVRAAVAVADGALEPTGLPAPARLETFALVNGFVIAMVRTELAATPDPAAELSGCR